MSRIPIPLQSLGTTGIASATNLQGSQAVGEIATSIIDAASNTSLTSDTTGLNQSEYDFSYKYFPEDIGNDYVGHYMVININVPTTLTGETRGRGNYTGFSTLLPNELSKVDNLRFNPAFANIPGQTAGASQREFASLPRFTRRIKESIALFMPSSLVHTTQNAYEEISLTALAGRAMGVAFSALTGAGGAWGGQTVKTAMDNASKLGGLVNTTGTLISQVAGLAKMPINPRIEVVYSTTPQRQFVFEVMMAPRSEKEALSIEAIIKTLRFHAAPEIDTLLGAGILLIPPAEFDITFFNKGVENTHIPRINTCVLERIEADYAPTGAYATFRDGHPVAVRLSMAFREIEMPHKRRILEGF
jgi:hypothetical protein